MSASDAQQEDGLKEALITYEKLQSIENDFEEVEVEIIRQQDKLTRDIYARRREMIANIPNFWALVLEQAPPDIDEYIQPSDSQVLSQALVSLSVERFELPDGDPRSISIKWEFKENEWFEDTVLEKKFWWRYANDDWSGLVSEPVDIKWKEGKDLTNGMLGLVAKLWEEEKKSGVKAGQAETETETETETGKKLKELMDGTGLGGVSFFAWFGFCGRKISAEESREAWKKEQEKRKSYKDSGFENVKMDDDDDDANSEFTEFDLEIFPTGDDLAVCIAEDLWPGAIKYFTAAQEDDENLSDFDFESDYEMNEDEEEEEKEDPPSKKRKV